MNVVQLKRLEAYGFKSFADRLEIEFDKGITAIVGPNGSGKSNITDAVRWVLGEQNVRNLRGTRAEDIIFTGSATRRALGVAEVSLTFDNSDGQLSLDFKEVVITRRLFRSGESEFYINKAKCRLKDIYELFADTGLGRDAISVISQNKIDEVLNSRPEERRLLFEETAGITKYRNRKKESLRKLADTEQNLLRVKDILSEIENQLEPLQLQAEKTTRHQQLSTQYRDCKLTQNLYRYEAGKKAVEESQARLQKLKDDELAQLTIVQRLEADKEQLDRSLLQAEQDLQKYMEENHRLEQAMEKNDREMALLEERCNQSGRMQQSLEIDTGELLKYQKTLQREYEETVQKQAEQLQKKAALENDIQKKQALETELDEKLGQQTALLAELRRKSEAEMAVQNELQKEAALLERDIEETVRRLSEEEAVRKRLADEAGRQEAALQMLQEEINAQSVQEQQCGEQEERQRQQYLQAEQNREDEKLQLQKLQQKLQQEQARLHILGNLQRDYDGFGRAVKAVLKSSAPWQKKICGAVAELIQVDKPYVLAIETALGGSLQHVVTEDPQTAKQAIAFLKQGHLGRVTFLPLTALVVKVPEKSAVLRNVPGFIGYANELVQIEPRYQKAADFLLARTIIMDTIDHALLLAEKQGYRSRIVTLEGEILHPGGSMAGGSNLQKESSFLNRKEELTALALAVEQKEAEIHKKQEQLQAGAQVLAGQKQALQQKQAQLQELKMMLARQRIGAEKEKASLERTMALLQQQEEKLGLLQMQQDELRDRDEQCKAKLALQESAGQLRQADVEAADCLQDLQMDKEDLKKVLVRLQIEQTVMEQEMLRLQDQCHNKQSEIDRTNKEISRKNQEKNSLQEKTAVWKQEIEKWQQENAKLAVKKAEQQKVHEEAYQLRMELLVQQQQNEKKIRQEQKGLQENREKVHRFELEQTRKEMELEQWEAQLLEEYQLTPKEAGNRKMDLSLPELQRRMKEIEAEMEALGSINPHAVEEYTAVRQRYDFLSGQTEDLISAKADLAAIIAEIDQTMAKQFREAFAEIGEYFSNIFIRLFGGGQAKLRLTDAEDILASGIEIEVQPPEKKLQNLSVLSGGERALTVIALLFAFLQYKPAPFSVVDEIDAPLDEANVNRFAAFLQEYAENTQFIVVTHRKGTMEAANVMFGVTVEDAGVSKIVSVRLSDTIN